MHKAIAIIVLAMLVFCGIVLLFLAVALSSGLSVGGPLQRYSSPTWWW